MTSDLEARVAALEAQLAKLREELKEAAHELRQDSDFMKPASETLAEHVTSYLFDKAARRLLWLVLGIFGAAGLGLAMWLGGRGFK